MTGVGGGGGLTSSSVPLASAQDEPSPICTEPYGQKLTAPYARCALLIADYKAKVLPGRYRETQTEAYGKKGKSLWGCTAIRWDAASGDCEVLMLSALQFPTISCPFMPFHLLDIQA